MVRIAKRLLVLISKPAPLPSRRVARAVQLERIVADCLQAMVGELNRLQAGSYMQAGQSHLDDEMNYVAKWPFSSFKNRGTASDESSGAWISTRWPTALVTM